MKTSTRLLSLLLLTAFVLGACNFPSAEKAAQNASATAAAETVQALLPSATSTGFVFPPTFTPIPGLPATATTAPATIAPAATATSNCNVMQFVADITIPDGTIMNPNQAFTKTWRLRNDGTCAWTTSYAIVFSSGNSMNGPATQALTGNVNPGQTVDISVNLTAPGSVDNYRGNWKLRDASGVLFGTFYVDIKVQNAPTATNTLPPAVAQVVLTGLTGEDGFVTSSGTTNAIPNVGDNDSNQAVQAFVSFDMSAIPPGANITKVVVDFSNYDMLGSPWGLSDGCLRAYAQNYGTVDAGDYFGGAPSGAYIRWCGAPELSSASENADLKTLVQSLVGSSRLQLRLQFTSPNPSNNGTADMVRFGTIKLTITYQ
jgi:hypothetical protein